MIAGVLLGTSTDPDLIPVNVQRLVDNSTVISGEAPINGSVLRPTSVLDPATILRETPLSKAPSSALRTKSL